MGGVASVVGAPGRAEGVLDRGAEAAVGAGRGPHDPEPGLLAGPAVDDQDLLMGERSPTGGLLQQSSGDRDMTTGGYPSRRDLERTDHRQVLPGEPRRTSR